MGMEVATQVDAGSHRGAIEIVGSVPRVDGSTLSYEDFWTTYMAANKPVVMTGLMDTWQANKDWKTADGRPNFDFFKEKFGSSKVQVADCGEQEFTDQKRLSMTVTEYMDYWKSLSRHRASQFSGVPDGAAENSQSAAKAETGCEGEGKLLYLKDWHFVKEYPSQVAYTTPLFFSQDWLNDYSDHCHLHEAAGGGRGEEGEEAGAEAREWKEGGEPRAPQSSEGGVECSDYRFVYMGPRGTWTPLHADVLRSYSWSANVCGRKRWLLLSPEQTVLLGHKHSSHKTVYNIEAQVSPSHFPDFHKTKWLECVQEEGEIIFVPSGCYHQVTNLEDSISINHNWLNACNLHWTWHLLQADYEETVKAIEDVREIAEDFEALCQRNLAANSGMNFNDFFRFLVILVERDLRSLRSLCRQWCRSLSPDLGDPCNSKECQSAGSSKQTEQDKGTCLNHGPSDTCLRQKEAPIHQPQAHALGQRDELSIISEPGLGSHKGSNRSRREELSRCLMGEARAEVRQLVFNLERVREVCESLGREDLTCGVDSSSFLPSNQNAVWSCYDVQSQDETAVLQAPSRSIHGLEDGCQRWHRNGCRWADRTESLGVTHSHGLLTTGTRASDQVHDYSHHCFLSREPAWPEGQSRPPRKGPDRKGEWSKHVDGAQDPSNLFGQTKPCSRVSLAELVSAIGDSLELIPNALSPAAVPAVAPVSQSWGMHL